MFDNSRDLLLSDLSAIAFTSQRKAYVGTVYELLMLVNQHGATRGRSTDYATHLIGVMLDAASLCSYVDFCFKLDLSEAYDLILQKLVLAWPQDLATIAADYLRSLGLDN